MPTCPHCGAEMLQICTYLLIMAMAASIGACLPSAIFAWSETWEEGGSLVGTLIIVIGGFIFGTILLIAIGGAITQVIMGALG